MRKGATISLLIGCICANLYPRWASGITGDMFCFWVAVSFVLLSIASRIKSDGVIVNYAFELVIILSVNDATDEYFRIAEKINDYEILFGIGAVCWTLYRIISHTTKPRKK